MDLTIYVGSVPSQHLSSFHDKLKASLEWIAQKGFDMTRMQMVISRDERQVKALPAYASATDMDGSSCGVNLNPIKAIHSRPSSLAIFCTVLKMGRTFIHPWMESTNMPSSKRGRISNGLTFCGSTSSPIFAAVA